MIYKILLLAGVIFSAAAQFILKIGMNQIGVVKINTDMLGNLKKMATNPLLWLAVLCYGVGFILYAIVLSKLELSRTYPVALLAAIILVSIISILFFNESVSIYKIIGLILCVGGIAFLLM